MALDLNDKTANGNTLTNNNGAVEVTTNLPFAQSSRAADLEKDSSQYFSAADSASLSPTGDLTIEMWIKFESLPINGGSFMTFCAKGLPPDEAWFFAVYQAAGVYNLYFELSQNGATADASSFAWSTPTTGVWYHVAYVFTAASSKHQMFVDGVQLGADYIGSRTAIFNSTSPLIIGANGTPSNFFDGQIDDVRIWNTNRSSTQITNNKDVEIISSGSGIPLTLVGYWPFEENGSASVSPSSSASPSASQSPSSSISRSASASVSPSSSVSASRSPSVSPSASRSPSASVSRSTSPSASASHSASASPSLGFGVYSRGDVLVLPTTTADLETLYTDNEEETIASRNDTGIEQTAAAQYMIHQFKSFIGTRSFVTVEWEGHTDLAPSLSPVYLQIYNHSTLSWETVDSNNKAPVDVDFELEKKVKDTTNYRSSGILTSRVYQLAI